MLLIRLRLDAAVGSCKRRRVRRQRRYAAVLFASLTFTTDKPCKSLAQDKHLILTPEPKTPRSSAGNQNRKRTKAIGGDWKLSHALSLDPHLASREGPSPHQVPLPQPVPTHDASGGARCCARATEPRTRFALLSRCGCGCACLVRGSVQHLLHVDGEKGRCLAAGREAGKQVGISDAFS